MNVSDNISFIDEGNGDQLDASKMNGARKGGKTVEPGSGKTSQMRGIGRTPSSVISAGGPGSSKPAEGTVIGFDEGDVKMVSHINEKARMQRLRRKVLISSFQTKPNTKKSESGSRWEALDAQFRRGLPDSTYAGRLAYRGLVMRACPNVRMLDGVRVSEKERIKAEGLLKRLLGEEDPDTTIRGINPS